MTTNLDRLIEIEKCTLDAMDKIEESLSISREIQRNFKYYEHDGAIEDIDSHSWDSYVHLKHCLNAIKVLIGEAKLREGERTQENLDILREKFRNAK